MNYTMGYSEYIQHILYIIYISIMITGIITTRYELYYSLADIPLFGIILRLSMCNHQVRNLSKVIPVQSDVHSLENPISDKI